MATPSSSTRPPRRTKSTTNRRLLCLVCSILAALIVHWRIELGEIVQKNSSSSSVTTTSNSTSRAAASSSSSCPSFNKQKVEEAAWKVIFENANAKIAERRDWLIRDDEAQFFGALTGAQLWYLFVPVLPCFWTFEKKPGVAVVHDGGKWLCGMHQVHEYRRRRDDTAEYGVGKHYDDHQTCIVYSMGSADSFDFESRVRTLAPGCEIHTFDPTRAETGKGKPFYDSYHGDYGFGAKDQDEGGQFPTKSIATIMRELGHQHVDYLKIDVEGYEWDFLDEVDWSSVRVGQLLMEWHPAYGRRKKTKFFGRDPNATEMNRMFTKLEESGFYLISVEPVTFRNWGQVEVVFIHKDWRPQGFLQP